MKRLILIFAFVLFCSTCWAGVEVKNLRAIPDPVFEGQIAITGEYWVDEIMIQDGTISRFRAESGTDENILDKVLSDAKIHSQNLIYRKQSNTDYVKQQYIERTLSLQRPVQDIIDTLNTNLLNKTINVDSFVIDNRGEEIEIFTNSDPIRTSTSIELR